MSDLPTPPPPGEGLNQTPKPGEGLKHSPQPAVPQPPSPEPEAEPAGGGRAPPPTLPSPLGGYDVPPPPAPLGDDPIGPPPVGAPVTDAPAGKQITWASILSLLSIFVGCVCCCSPVFSIPALILAYKARSDGNATDEQVKSVVIMAAIGLVGNIIVVIGLLLNGESTTSI